MGQKETREEWFKRGFWLPRRDAHRGLNEGLSKRERKALAEENTRPWGQTMWAQDAVTKRAKKAKAQAKAKKKGGGIWGSSKSSDKPKNKGIWG